MASFSSFSKLQVLYTKTPAGTQVLVSALDEYLLSRGQCCQFSGLATPAGICRRPSTPVALQGTSARTRSKAPHPGVVPSRATGGWPADAGVGRFPRTRFRRGSEMSAATTQPRSAGDGDGRLHGLAAGRTTQVEQAFAPAGGRAGPRPSWRWGLGLEIVPAGMRGEAKRAAPFAAR